MSAPPTSLDGAGAARAIRSSAVAVATRQGAQILFALIMARLLGPDSFGVLSAAMVYATATALLLDQGLSAALVQRPVLTDGAPGAVASLNFLAAALLALITWFCAPLIGDFFDSGQLVPIVRILGLGLVLKAAAVTPRALLARNLRLGQVAVADVTGALTGTAAGLVVAFLGAGPRALLVQVLLTDLVVAICLLTAARGPRPTLHLRELAPLLGFSTQVFGANAIAYLSRNLDNVLVGRFLGLDALAHYAMAYRVLTVPVQFLGQTVKRMLFPAFARANGDREQQARLLLTASELLSLGAVPVMVVVACAAPDLVAVVLGAPWAATAPLMSVLALAGARETVFYITPSLVTASGRGRTVLRVELLSTGVQVVGILAGLSFGAFGVALGYGAAGLVLTPLWLSLQRRLTGVTIRQQLSALWPALHVAAWAGAAYLACRAAGAGPWTTLGAGAACAVLVGGLVLRLAHPAVAARCLRRVRAVLR